ncbi:hypothetical protein [Alcanivorax sediminis]|uniref:hypothetical protein n=1 Tax=Alcanivorax sediminis TaxID=2663008 RepID=UPI001885BA36|nr:hypothetical protein [Alcanivorax sediminis]
MLVKKIHSLVTALHQRKRLVIFIYVLAILPGIWHFQDIKSFFNIIFALVFIEFFTRLYIIRDLPFVSIASNHVPEDAVDIIDYGFGLLTYIFGIWMAAYIYLEGIQ